MELLVMSDLHLEHHAMAIESGDFEAIILAGDIHAPGHQGVLWAAREPAFENKPVFYVPGNHEFYGRQMETELALMRTTAEGTNVRVLDREAVTVQTAVIGDVRFLGCTLWTDFSLPVRTGSGWVRDPKQAADQASWGMNDFHVIRVARGAPQRGTLKLRAQDTVRLNQAARVWLGEQLAQPWAGRTVVITHHARIPSPRWGVFGQLAQPGLCE